MRFGRDYQAEEQFRAILARHVEASARGVKGVAYDAGIPGATLHGYLSHDPIPGHKVPALCRALGAEFANEVIGPAFVVHILEAEPLTTDGAAHAVLRLFPALSEVGVEVDEASRDGRFDPAEEQRIFTAAQRVIRKLAGFAHRFRRAA